MKRGETAWRWASALAVGLPAAAIGAGYIALILAELGLFSPLPCAAAAGIAGTAAAWAAFRRFEPIGPAEKAGWLAACLIAAGSLAMTLPPGETILGGWDPGVYVQTAAAIARHGSLQIPADDIAMLPAALKQNLTRDVSGWQQPFPGMFPLQNGRLSPQFMHLYPSLLAAGYSAAGVWGALLVNPILNVFAILAMYWFASKVLGRGWAVAAALLLAVNPAQVWQAKFSTAEMLTQVLLIAGFGAFLDFTRRRAALLPAVLSGLLFGLAFFTRYDAMLVLVPLVLFLIPLKREPDERRGVFAFLAALAIVGVHAWWHMAFVAPCYRPLPDLVFPALILALSFGVALIAGVQFAAGRIFVALLTSRPTLLRVGVLIGFASFLVLAWYVRPHLTVDGRVFRFVQSGLDLAGMSGWIGNLAGENALNIRYLASVFGPFGLLLGFAGVGALIWRSSDRGVIVWLLASLAATMILVANVFHDHFMMWVSRRFIPVAVPLLVVGIVAAAKETHRLALACRRPLAVPLAAGVLAAVIVLAMPKTVAMASSRDWPGLCSWYESLASMIPSDAIVFCDQPGFAAPLRFIYGVNAFEVYGGGSCGEFVSDNKLRLRELNGSICLLTMREQAAPQRGVAFREIGRATLASSTLEQPRRSVPMQTRSRGGRFVLYAVEMGKNEEER